MADVLLPHLRGRPLTLKRYPEGVELHTSLSLAKEIERPTAVVFDLDPGAPAGVLDCAQVALWIRGMFEQLSLDCYPKTSGSEGIQLYVPLNTDVTYERTRPFAKAVAETLEAKFGDRVVSRMAKAKRAGRVLVDWSRNDRRKTTVCVYSLRAGERPTVSTPLEWEELEDACRAGDPGRLVFGSAEALRRVEERGDLFAPLLSEKQELPG
jgi:bifunctional non-homologous end joining protein LigD